MRCRSAAVCVASILLLAACTLPSSDVTAGETRSAPLGRTSSSARASASQHSPSPSPRASATSANAATSAASSHTPPAGGLASAAQLATVRAQLTRLTVVPTPELVGYRRAAFGAAWEDVDRNGCNTREDVLFASVIRTLRWADRTHRGCDHDMLSGSWRDPYTGRVMTFTNLKNQSQAQAIQIDHQVALATAWRYGADRWTDEKRSEFANWQPNLVAVARAVNLEKGDLEPADWQPAAGEQCTFAVRVVNTLSVWHLSLSGADRSALAEMLATCR